MRFAPRAAVLTLVAVLAGCSDDECSRQESKCEDGKSYTCLAPSDPGDHTRWQINDCGQKTCLMIGPVAWCVLSTSPDPLCLSASTAVPPGIGIAVCEANKLVACFAGYRLDESDCGSRFCVPGLWSEPSSAKYPGFCALAEKPDSTCMNRCPYTPVDDASFCEACLGNTMLECRRNYRTEAEDCGDSATCTEIDNGPDYKSAVCLPR